MKKPKPYNNVEFTRVTLNPYKIDLSKLLDPSDYIIHYNEYYDEEGIYKSEILGEFIRANLYIPTIQVEICKNKNTYTPGTVEGSRNTFNRYNSLCPINKYLDDYHEIKIIEEVEPAPEPEPEPELAPELEITVEEPPLNTQLLEQIVNVVPIITDDFFDSGGNIKIEQLEDNTIYENKSEQEKVKLEKQSLKIF